MATQTQEHKMQVTAKILLLDPEYMGQFYFKPNPRETARELLAKDLYTAQGQFTLNVTDSEDAAEFLFDLTNNPSKDDLRAVLYGRGRSLSVGDIVDVDGELLLCANTGWQRVAYAQQA
jgi:hypothetical protein